MHGEWGMGNGDWGIRYFTLAPPAPPAPPAPLPPTPYSLLPTPRMHPLRAGTVNVNW